MAKHKIGSSDLQLSQGKQVDKDKLIQAEVDKLSDIFHFLPEDKKKLCEGLIQNAAFMKVTLEELQADVVEHGVCSSGRGTVRRRRCSWEKEG